MSSFFPFLQETSASFIVNTNDSLELQSFLLSHGFSDDYFDLNAPIILAPLQQQVIEVKAYTWNDEYAPSLDVIGLPLFMGFVLVFFAYRFIRSVF